MAYPKLPYTGGKSTALLYSGRMQDAIVHIRPELPGNVIVIHGVNDVGTSVGAVEKGLCQGLDARMYGDGHVFTPATYRLPQASDKHEVIADPDAIYFKCTLAAFVQACRRRKAASATGYAHQAGKKGICAGSHRPRRHPGQIPTRKIVGSAAEGKRLCQHPRTGQRKVSMGCHGKIRNVGWPQWRWKMAPSTSLCISACPC
nr:hypothetical protein [Janthinobacterium sp. ROICE36]